MITHVLDTSALLAHYFSEPGATRVNQLLVDGNNKIGICVVSVPELKTCLLEKVNDAKEVERAFELYADQLTKNLIVNRSIADIATHLRSTIRPRLPLVDSLIAACAQKYKAVLVHRDPHFDAIPSSTIKQLKLPDL